MPSVATEFACPTCAESGQTNRINATDGALICTGNGTHLWKDTDTFIKLGPKRAFTVTPPKFPDATSLSPLQLMIPTSVKDKLQAKFGKLTDTTVAGFITMLTEGDTLVIQDTDLKDITKQLKKRPESSAELKGLIYSTVMDKDTAVQNEKVATQKLQATLGKNLGMVVINLGDQLANAIDQAKGRDMSVDDFVEISVRNGIANNWF